MIVASKTKVTRPQMIPPTISIQWDHPNPFVYQKLSDLRGNVSKINYFNIIWLFSPPWDGGARIGGTLTLAASCSRGPAQRGHGLDALQLHCIRVDVASSLPLRRKLGATLGCGWRLLGYHCWLSAIAPRVPCSVGFCRLPASAGLRRWAIVRLRGTKQNKKQKQIV